MRAFVAASLHVLAWTAALWALLAAITCAWWPLENAQAPIRFDLPDYLDHKPSLFVGNTQNGVYELARRCPLPPKKRLILLGSSGARGFQPELLAGVSAADEVLNLSLVQSNFTQNRQLLRDLQPCLGDQGMRESAYLLIVSFGSFTSNEVRNVGGYSEYETEKLRSRLFVGAPGAVEPRVDRRWLPPLIELMRPALVARKALALAAIVPDLGAMAPDRSLQIIASHFAEIDGAADEDQRFALEQRRELDALVNEIRAAGAGLVVVEQPAQGWLRERSRAAQVAHRVLLATAQRESVPYIDLLASADDEEFHDPVHANPIGYARWGKRLASELSALQKQQPGALGALRR